MRLIDADTLIQKIDGWREQLAKTYGINDEYVKCLGEVLDIIEDAPTEDERKKGKWLRDPPEGGYALYKCSVCGECWLHWWASAMTVEKMTKEVRCCPHCGAEMVSNMRGDGNETN